MEEDTTERGDEVSSSYWEGASEISETGVFEVLRDERRRHLLRCLRGRGTPMALADLARDVAARERETTRNEIPSEEVERICVSLYHVHVPKLEDEGIVEYNPSRNTVAPTSTVRQLASILESIDGDQ